MPRILGLVALLALLAVALPAPTAYAGGDVSVCDEATLRSALASGGTVTFSCSGTIVLTSTITIAAGTSLDGTGQNVTLSGGGVLRLFRVSSGGSLTLQHLTIADGSGGAIYAGAGAAVTVRDATFTGNSAPSGGGAAIQASGATLTISGSTFSGNSARIGGAVYSEAGTLDVTNSRFTGNGNTATDGGAIYSTEGAATVIGSTFDGNTANQGGAIGVNAGTVTLANSTLSGNNASFGGGIENLGGSSITVINSTIAGNSAGRGAGVGNLSGTVTLKNTIVANNVSGANCTGAIVNGGGNLSYPDASCPGVNANPRLAPLRNNGGPTPTLSPVPGSAAIDAGNDAICAVAPVSNVDQRGGSRAGQGTHCDIGAYEVMYYRVTKTQDDDGECLPTDCALREAIMARNAALGHDVILVPAGTYVLTLATPAGGEDGPGTGDLDITDDLTIMGDAASTTIIHQGTSDRVMEIGEYPSIPSVAISNVTIENGSADHGGGILFAGDVTLAACRVQGNRAAESGGGVYGGGTPFLGYYTMTVRDSTFSGNNSSFGGGIYSTGALNITGSTFSGNTAGSAGAILSERSLYVFNSTFTGNTAASTGGGIWSRGKAELVNVTLAGNGAGTTGNFINSGGREDARYTNTIFANPTSGDNCWGYQVDGGGNLTYPDHTCHGVNSDPLLGPLQDNGGPTQTMALGVGSAAIDAGNTAGCLDVRLGNRDQRGHPRFSDGNGDTLPWCDIGAYEAESLAGYPQWEGGKAFTCEVTLEGAVQCFGRNKEGQATAPSGVFRQVTAGGVHACAIRAGDSKVTCWGSNTMPVHRCVSETCDTVYIDTGQARPPDGAFVQVSAGGYHTCGLKYDGSVDCWGSNTDDEEITRGQAQDQPGPFTQLSVGMWHNCAVKKADGTVQCWGDTRDGKATPPSGVVFTQVAAGQNHTCGLKPDGSVACWGGNSWGQAPAARPGPYKEIRAGDLFTCGLKPDGILDCWGYNFYGQTKEPASALKTFGLGDAHGCGTLVENGEWVCWGRNDQDQAPDNPNLPPQGSEPEDQAPVVQIFLTPSEPDGLNNWYRTRVTVEPQASDDTGVAELRCVLDPASQPSTFDDLPAQACPFLEGAAVTTDAQHTFYAAAMDLYGNTSTIVKKAFQIDATPPIITCPAGGPFLLGSGDPLIGPAGVDASVAGLDEAASELTSTIPTGSIGTQTVTFTAKDLAGNQAAKACTYQVVYDFGGFYPPVEPARALTAAKAGSTVPVKFSLAGDQGLAIVAAGYPVSEKVDCGTLAPVGTEVPTATAGESGLSYDPKTARYNYVWKTDKSWAGACRAFTLTLADGTEHAAYFQFK